VAYSQFTCPTLLAVTRFTIAFGVVLARTSGDGTLPSAALVRWLDRTVTPDGVVIKPGGFTGVSPTTVVTHSRLPEGIMFLLGIGGIALV